jgi:hypothetical protein
MSDDLITPHPSRAARRRPRDERVRRFKRELLKVAPHLNDPIYGPLLHSFARISILSLDAYEYLRQHGLIGDDGELRRSVHTAQLLVHSQLKLATALGLAPLALAKLKTAPTDDLASALAK